MANENPVPQNQPLQAFPTPNVGDVLIYVVQDSKAAPFHKVKDYGAPYPNKADYPDHKLVFIAPIDEDGNRRYYYACDRAKQDAYNYEISHPYGGRKDAPRYTRTYILKREGYTPLAGGTADPVFATAILIGHEMKRIGQQELDSLYVVVRRTYDTIPAPTEFDGASSATSAVYGIKVDFPDNDEAFPRLTWRIPVKHSGYAATADLSACPVSGYTSLVLVDQEYQQDAQSAQLGAWVRVYEKLPSRVNYAPSTDQNWGKTHIFSWRQSEYVLSTVPAIGANYTYTDTASVVSYFRVVRVKTTPARGSVISVSVETVKVASSGADATGTLKHSQVTDGDWGSADKYEQWGMASRTLPDIGDASPIGTGTVLTAQLMDDDGTFANLVVTTLAVSSGTVKNGTEIDQIFCVSQTVSRKVPSSTNMGDYARGTYVTVGDASGYVLDAQLRDEDGTNATLILKLTSSNQQSVVESKLDIETGLIYPETKIYSIGGTAPSGQAVQADASYRVTDRLGCNFWVSTASKTTTLTSESYTVIVPAKWPAVLTSWRFDALYLQGGVTIDRYMFDYFLKKEYIGPCRATYRRSWSKNAPSVVVPKMMIPDAMVYDGILASFSIPPCLHPYISVFETTGSNHPTYEYTTRSKSFDATYYTQWPSSIIQDVEIRRYRGGFIKEEIEVYAPT